MATGRMRRVDEAIRQVIGDAAAASLKDPRVGFVTVTDVRTSRDLRQARVYVSVLGESGRPSEQDEGVGQQQIPDDLVEEGRLEGGVLRVGRGPVRGIDLQGPGQVRRQPEELLIEVVADPPDRLCNE